MEFDRHTAPLNLDQQEPDERPMQLLVVVALYRCVTVSHATLEEDV